MGSQTLTHRPIEGGAPVLVVDGQDVPAGTVVSMPAYCLAAVLESYMKSDLERLQRPHPSLGASHD